MRMKSSTTFIQRFALPLTLCVVAIPRVNAQSTNASAAKPDPWKPMHPFVGTWTGDAKGESGDGRSEREYKFVLDHGFMRVGTRGLYPVEGQPTRRDRHVGRDLSADGHAAHHALVRWCLPQRFVRDRHPQRLCREQRP